MLYFFYGDDRTSIQNKTTEIIESLKKKRPDSEVILLDEYVVSIDTLMEKSESQGLFDEKLIVLARDYLRDHDLRELRKILESLRLSENIFLCVESDLPKNVPKVIEEYAERSQYFELVQTKKIKDFSAFSLAEALAERNVPMLWRRYREAVTRGYALEEVYGILFWQLKSMQLTHLAKSPEEVDMKPYPWKKSLTAAQKYTKAELLGYVSELPRVHHKARLEGYSSEYAIEHFILSLGSKA